MVKHFFSLLLFTTVSIAALAQDTTAYEIQRAKINGLLARRSAKFGEYAQSLNARTGIFGLQTKKDIKNSNEILRQIALTDNDIFKELKILLDYKDIQMDQAKTTVDYSKESILNYRKTIRNLQLQQKEVRNQLENAQNSILLAYFLMLVCLAGCVSLAYFLKQQMKSRRPSTSLK